MLCLSNTSSGKQRCFEAIKLMGLIDVVNFLLMLDDVLSFFEKLDASLYAINFSTFCVDCNFSVKHYSIFLCLTKCQILHQQEQMIFFLLYTTLYESR